jgi:hypothetical protein
MLDEKFCVFFLSKPFVPSGQIGSRIKLISFFEPSVDFTGLLLPTLLSSLAEQLVTIGC